MEQLYMDVLKLVRSGLTETACSFESEPDWEGILKISDYQGLNSIIYRAVRISNISITENILTRLKAGFFSDIRLNRLQMKELEILYGCFDENNLDYLPIKGAVMKALYPDPVFRWMSDADIVIRPGQYEKISRIMRDTGYDFVFESNNEYRWEKAGFVVELHKTVFKDKYAGYFEYFRDVFCNAAKKEGTCRYEQDASEEMAYQVAHFAKHYISGGLRFRSLLDIHYLLANRDIDEARLRCSLEKVKLYRFYGVIRKTAEQWAFGLPLDREGELLISTTLRESKEFNDEKGIIFHAAKESGAGIKPAVSSKIKTTFKRTFRPYRIMKKEYPVLAKAPVLLPFCWVRRGAEVLFFRRENLKRFMKIEWTQSPAVMESYMKELRTLGLESAILPEEL